MPETAPPPDQIPEAVLSGWRTEVGHRAEEDLLQIMTSKLGAKELSPEEIMKPEVIETLQSEQKVAIARATARQDFEEGIDFLLFNPLAGHLIRLDLSISGDPRVHAEKREREKTRGIRFLPIPKRTVDLAAKGGYEALEQVNRAFTSLMIEDALESARKGELSLTPSRRETLEKNLQKLQSGEKIH